MFDFFKKIHWKCPRCQRDLLLEYDPSLALEQVHQLMQLVVCDTCYDRQRHPVRKVRQTENIP